MSMTAGLSGPGWACLQVPVCEDYHVQQQHTSTQTPIVEVEDSGAAS